MRMQARNRLQMLDGSVAARRPTDSEGMYSWVWVAPIKDAGYRIRAFEVAKELVDNDACFYEADMNSLHDEVVESLDQIDAAVRRAGVDPEELDAPWHSDFPL
jgi:hypothetical protein